MRIFIFEHICGGGLSKTEFASGLEREGGAMLGALLEDALDAGFDVITTLDERVGLPHAGPRLLPCAPDSRPPRGSIQVRPVVRGESMELVFDEIAPQCDAALIVAPEFEGLLSGWQSRIREMGVGNLGSSSEAVALAGDKFLFARVMENAGVPVPTTVNNLESGALLASASVHGVVAKPRFGAGCIDTFFCATANDLAALPNRNDWIVQPWIPGTSCSAAYLVQGVRVTPLRAGQQTIRRLGPGKLGYGGGRMPLALDLEARALSLGEKAVRSIPGLHGFVGVDIILGPTPSDDRVIELNPRPTVAYVGLRQLSTVNLITRLLQPATPAQWNDLNISYTSDGQILRT